jgi:hypothetical protein
VPNRQRVIKVLTQSVLGAQQFNGLIGETVNMPIDDYEAVEDAMAGLLERVVAAVDWPRLLMEASWRHVSLHLDKEELERYRSEAAGVCGECLAEAMLQDRAGAPDWDNYPTSPREFVNMDWPTVVSTNLKHREAAHWHPFKEEK